MTGKTEWLALSAQFAPETLGEFLVSEVPLLGQRKRPITTFDQPLQDLWSSESRLPQSLAERGVATAGDVLRLGEDEFSKQPDFANEVRDVIKGYVEKLAILPHTLVLSRAFRRQPLPVFPENEQEVVDLINFGLANGFEKTNTVAGVDLWRDVVVRHYGLDDGIGLPSSRLAKELGIKPGNVEDFLQKGIQVIKAALMREYADENDEYRGDLIGWRILPLRSIGRIALRSSFVKQLSEFDGARIVISDEIHRLVNPPMSEGEYQTYLKNQIDRDTAQNFVIFTEYNTEGQATTTIPLDGLLALDLDALNRSEFIKIMDLAEYAILDHRDLDKRRVLEIAKAFADRQHTVDITDEEIEEQQALGNRLIPEVIFGIDEFAVLSNLRLSQVTERLGIQLDDVDDSGLSRRDDLAGGQFSEGLSKDELVELELWLKIQGITTVGDLLSYSRTELAKLLDGQFNNEVKRVIWEVLAFPNEFESQDDYFQNIAKHMPPGQIFFSLFKNAQFIDELLKGDFAIYRELQ